MKPEPARNVLRFAFAVLLGAGIGVLGTLAATSGDWKAPALALPQTDAEKLTVSAPPASALVPDASGAVSVADQAAGDSVLIESVTVPPPGVWAVVHEYDGAERGNALGAERVHGPVSHVVVPLLRSTVPGMTYAVVLYRDNGDGVFNLADDSVYVDFDTGQPVVAPFKTLPEL